jgi:hypothetical protein
MLIPVFAQSVKIEFLETRHIEALNEKSVRAGEIEIEGDRVSVSYLSPHERKITLENGIITMQAKNSSVQKSVEEKQHIAYMFTVFKAIFEKDENGLKKFFKLTNDGKDIVLTPFSTSAPLSQIIYSIEADVVKKIEIFSMDSSRIVIDVVEKR